MDSLKKESIAALRNLIGGGTTVSIVGHTHPDGDALGAASGLALWLGRHCGMEVSCIFPDSPGQNLEFILPKGLPFIFFDKEPEKAGERIGRSGLIFLADCNSFSRTEGLKDAMEASGAPKVLIDHHLNPDVEKFSLVFSTPEVSSASELVFHILKALGWKPSAEGGDIGEALLTGMTTDTNNFANSVFPSTFEMASELIAAGVDRDAVLQKIYNSYRETRIRLFGYMQADGMKILPCGAAYMILDKDILRRFDVREGETEGLVNVPLAVGQVKLSVLLKEENGVFRVSIRSKRGTSAQNLAQNFFHGGGHENAAGGKLLIGQDIASPADAEAFLLNALEKFMK